MHYMFHRSASDIIFQVLDWIMLFIQLGNLHVGIYFGVVNNLFRAFTRQKLVNQQVSQWNLSNVTLHRLYLVLGGRHYFITGPMSGPEGSITD